MGYSKYYTRINWKNRPSTSTALGATNLNHMDTAVDELDNRVVTLDDTKLNVSDASSLINGLEIDPNTGKITAAFYNGSIKQWDLNLEKIPVSFLLSEDGILTMTTDDGTEFSVNISDLIVDFAFSDSTDIGFTDTQKDGVRSISAKLRAGSVTADKLDPQIQGEIRDDRLLAQTAAADSRTYADDSRRYAVGGVIAADTDDNAKYYCEKAEESCAAAQESETAAAASETAAASSMQAAAASETASASSAKAALDSETAAAASALNAKASETAAVTSELKAAASQKQAAGSENNAKASETAAALSEKNAGDSAAAAGTSASEAESWAQKAEQVSNVSIATNQTAGIVRGADGEIEIDENGTMSISTDFTEPVELSELTGTEDKKSFFGTLAKAVKSLIAHLTDKVNPHEVTKEQVGLGNADDTADADKNVASAVKASQDSAGQQINATYVKNIAVNGRTVTITKGDGTEFTFETQDTVISLLNNLETTLSGQGALDAAQGKLLMDEINHRLKNITLMKGFIEGDSSVSDHLKELDISEADTVESAVKKLNIGVTVIYTSSHQSAFSASLPVTSGGILLIFKHGNRASIYFNDYRTGKLWAAGITDNIITDWVSCNGSPLINNLLTNVPGLGALDAAQGKALNDRIGTVDQRMGGFEFSVSSDGIPMYKPAGADTALPFKRLRLIRSGLSSQYDQTVDVSAVDNNYQKYTSSDFLLTFDAIAYGAITNEADYGGAVSLSYNPATGMMSIPRRKYFFRSGQESWVIYSVYLV